MQLIVRTGDQLEVAPGDFRIIEFITFVSNTGNSDGRPSGFNNRGQVAFLASFTGGSGIFVSNRVAVPEPSTLLHLCFGSLAALWRRSSKIKQRSQFSIDFDGCRPGQTAQSTDDRP